MTCDTNLKCHCSITHRALQCLQITVRILSAFEGHDNEIVEQALSKLKALSAMSPSGDNSEPVGSAVVSKTVSEILRERVTHAQLLPLLYSLVDSLLDQIVSSARGTSMVLCSVVETRGSELYTHVADLVSDKIHSKLVVLDEAETRVSALTCAKLLASFNPRDTANTLLKQHRLPLDDSVDSIWRVLTQEAALAENIMRYLVEIVSSSDLYSSEDYDAVSKRRIRVARHLQLAAIEALGIMFEMKEMEAICDGEFDGVFVPLLTAMGAYMGVGSVENAVKPRLSNPPAAADEPKAEIKRRNNPFQTAKSTLRAFLNCKGCKSVAAIVEGFERDLGAAAGGGDGALVGTFADELVSPLVDAVIQDFPQLLARLLGGFQPYLNASSSRGGNLVAAVAFSARLAQEDTESVDAALAEKAIENLLSALTWKSSMFNEPEEKEKSQGGETGDGGVGINEAGDDDDDGEQISVKVLCIKSLACYKLQQDANEREVKNFGSLILNAFLEVVGGEDLKSDLNNNALLGLDTLLKKDVVAESDVQRIMGEISSKVRVFVSVDYLYGPTSYLKKFRFAPSSTAGGKGTVPRPSAPSASWPITPRDGTAHLSRSMSTRR